MMLPQMQYPLYEVSILSQKDPLKIRPFTVREEKIMMMAVEGNDINSIVSSLRQIIENCVVGEINITDLPMVDIETIFLNLRARSVGETGSQFFKCKNEIVLDPGPGDTVNQPLIKECGMLLEVPIKFLEVPIVNKDVERDIKFNDQFGVRMRYPTYALTQVLLNTKPEDIEVAIAAHCVEMVYNNQEVFKCTDWTQEEAMEFILKLPTDKYELVKNFCLNVPKNQLVVEKECKKCSYKHTFTLEGIQDFFE